MFGLDEIVAMNNNAVERASVKPEQDDRLMMQNHSPYNCVSREEHERAVQEAYDNGYNAGRADALMDDQYSTDDDIFPDFEPEFEEED